MPGVVEDSVDVDTPFTRFDLPVAPVAGHLGENLSGTDLGKDRVYRRVEKLRFPALRLIGVSVRDIPNNPPGFGYDEGDAYVLD